MSAFAGCTGVYSCPLFFSFVSLFLSISSRFRLDHHLNGRKPKQATKTRKFKKKKNEKKKIGNCNSNGTNEGNPKTKTKTKKKKRYGERNAGKRAREIIDGPLRKRVYAFGAFFRLEATRKAK